MLPHETAGLDQSFSIEHVDRNDVSTGRKFLLQPGVRLAPLHRNEVDEPHLSVRLRREMTSEIRFVHRRDRMARHDRVPVEPVHGALNGRQQVTAGLIAAHAGIRNDHRRPSIEPPRRDIDGASDRADMRSRVEGRAYLVVNNRCAGGGEQIEYRRQVFVHPLRALRPGHAGYTDHPRTGKGTQALRRRRRQKQYRFEASKGSCLHRSR